MTLVAVSAPVNAEKFHAQFVRLTRLFRVGPSRGFIHPRHHRRGRDRIIGSTPFRHRPAARRLDSDDRAHRAPSFVRASTPPAPRRAPRASLRHRILRVARRRTDSIVARRTTRAHPASMCGPSTAPRTHRHRRHHSFIIRIPDRSRRLRGRPRVCCAHMTFDDRFHAYHTTCINVNVSIHTGGRVEQPPLDRLDPAPSAMFIYLSCTRSVGRSPVLDRSIDRSVVIQTVDAMEMGRRRVARVGRGWRARRDVREERERPHRS